MARLVTCPRCTARHPGFGRKGGLVSMVCEACHARIAAEAKQRKAKRAGKPATPSKTTPAPRSVAHIDGPSKGGSK